MMSKDKRGVYLMKSIYFTSYILSQIFRGKIINKREFLTKLLEIEVK